MTDITFNFVLPQDPSEIWLPIPSFEGIYDVSNFGRVKAVKASKGYKAGHIFAPNCTPAEYFYVGLRRDGKRKKYYVHRLVLMAFKPIEGYEGLDVNHINGLRWDNCPENLEWLSHKDNIRYSIDVLGTFKPFDTLKGNRRSNAKMTPEMVREIRAMAATGIHYKAISELYPMTPGAIHHIISRRTWKHID